MGLFHKDLLDAERKLSSSNVPEGLAMLEMHQQEVPRLDTAILLFNRDIQEYKVRIANAIKCLQERMPNVNGALRETRRLKELVRNMKSTAHDLIKKVLEIE